jgi:ribonuclease P protein component
MFAKKSDIKSLGRLKKRSDFLWIQQSSKEKNQKWVSKGFIIELAENNGLGVRYGLTVSKRVSKLAVLRNRTKRRLKSVSCDVLPKFTHHNIDIVLIGRVSTAERTYEELQRDLIWCLKRLGFEMKASDEKNSD